MEGGLIVNSKRARLIRKEVLEFCRRADREDEMVRLYRRAKKHYLRTGNMPLDGLRKGG